MSYTTIATTAEFGLDVRTFNRASLAWDCLAMLRERVGIQRVALYQDNSLLVAFNSKR
jgi:hypothetical protein